MPEIPKPNGKQLAALDFKMAVMEVVNAFRNLVEKKEIFSVIASAFSVFRFRLCVADVLMSVLIIHKKFLSSY